MIVIVVSGAIANKYLHGGAVWTRLSWILGLKKLGFTVYFIEQIDPATCVDEEGVVVGFEQSANLAYFRRIMEDFGLSERAALIYDGGRQTHGLAYNDLLDIAENASLLVNISGHLTLEPIRRRFRRTAYIDLDPGYTQYWHLNGVAGFLTSGHDMYFTVGENIGTRHCDIPCGEIRWLPIRQPVVLEYWPVGLAGSPDRFTTVASWRGPYGPVEHGGHTFGVKVHEWRKFIELPTRVPARFEIALDISPADTQDLERLQRHGWCVANPRVVAPHPALFRDYVQQSSAEFSVAQGIYVSTESGWFSDRTARYLASGKPALVQDTGFSRNYPVGEGLVAFRTLAEAIDGAERITLQYEQHSQAARMIAQTYFDSTKVLKRFVEQAF